MIARDTGLKQTLGHRTTDGVVASGGAPGTAPGGAQPAPPWPWPEGAPSSLLPLSRRIPRALYVHLPFCARRCPYCDFATAPLGRELEAAYLEALGAELAARVPAGFRPRTVFLGGGTPTELTTPGLERLIELLAPRVAGAVEVTCEANPRTLLPRKLERLVAGLGVRRLSLGVQSFSPRVLATLGRVHRAEDVAPAVAAARAAGIASVNLDLIFAVPGQTPAELEHDLERAAALAPEHVSAYALTFERGTPFWAARRDGALRAQGDRRQARAYARVRRFLRERGFEHYEVSNYARPGHRCRHNVVYWRNHPSLGVGNGAASHTGGVRLVNHRDPAAYVEAIRRGGGEAAVAAREELDARRKTRETAYLALRTSAGLHPERFRRETGVDPEQAFAAELARLAELGLIERRGARLRLTGRGVGLADAAGRELL